VSLLFSEEGELLVLHKCRMLENIMTIWYKNR